MSNLIIEDTRTQLVSRGMSGKEYKDKSKGRNRYARRVKSKIANLVKQFNKLDMNKLFKEGALDVYIEVQGETDKYLVRFYFESFLDEVHALLKQYNKEFDLQICIKAIQNAFNKKDVYINCSCPDWYYRMGFWASQNNIIVGDKQKIPSPITNPDDKLGPACKHVLLCLTNTRWIMKLSSTIVNYIKYMKRTQEKLYADIIYPALYEKPYEEPVQLNIDDINGQTELNDDEDVIDVANQSAVDRSRFQVGNKQGIRFAPNREDKNQLNLDSLNVD